VDSISLWMVSACLRKKQNAKKRETKDMDEEERAYCVVKIFFFASPPLCFSFSFLIWSPLTNVAKFCAILPFGAACRSFRDRRGLFRLPDARKSELQIDGYLHRCIPYNRQKLLSSTRGVDRRPPARSRPLSSMSSLARLEGGDTGWPFFGLRLPTRTLDGQVCGGRAKKSGDGSG